MGEHTHPQKTHKLRGYSSIHGWTLLRRLPYKPKESSLKRLQWRCRCKCGKEEDVPEYYLLRKEGPKLDCGCGRKTLQTHFKQEHTIWTMMNYRCQNKNHVAYKHYGGRGINVCPEWHKDNPEGFKNFLDYIGARPSPGHSIDRVDNDGGYYPYQADGVTRQVRWATSKEQRANQGRKKP